MKYRFTFIHKEDSAEENELLKAHDKQICEVISDYGVVCEVRFEDGSELDVYPDELKKI